MTDEELKAAKARSSEHGYACECGCSVEIVPKLIAEVERLRGEAEVERLRGEVERLRAENVTPRELRAEDWEF